MNPIPDANNRGPRFTDREAVQRDHHSHPVKPQAAPSAQDDTAADKNTDGDSATVELPIGYGEPDNTCMFCGRRCHGRACNRPGCRN